MKEITNIITKTYDAGDGFFIDITQKGNYADAWIYHKDYGVKLHLYGTELKTEYVPDYDYFIGMVKNELEEDKADYFERLELHEML